jgi:hypothetical protein
VREGGGGGGGRIWMAEKLLATRLASNINLLTLANKGKFIWPEKCRKIRR